MTEPYPGQGPYAPVYPGPGGGVFPFQVGTAPYCGIGHKKHLCDLVARGEMSFEEFVKLVGENPKYVCKKCGRAAAKAENLCEPTPMKTQKAKTE